MQGARGLREKPEYFHFMRNECENSILLLSDEQV